MAIYCYYNVGKEGLALDRRKVVNISDYRRVPTPKKPSDFKVVRRESGQTQVEEIQSQEDGELHPSKMCDAVQEYLNVVHGEVSKALVAMRRMRFRSFQIDELVVELLASQPNDWRAEPVYYFALSQEIKERFTPPPTKS
jgi:hypothetical protein